jgi:superfamily II DNA or RNA helicase
LDTGLGKSLIELEFARQCADETGKPSLILTPLAVAGQMVREGQKFGIDARQIREQHEVGSGVMVANYERLAKLDPATFGAVVLDESSILKSYAGRTRALIEDAFAKTAYKLAATATPSPNDHTELGNHAEFLGVMRQQEMLSKWFINDTATASQEWRLKGHAVSDFWGWVASWSRCATLPSDLGGDDAGYVLPDVDRRIHTVAADRMENIAEGMLFRIPEMSATSFHEEKRLTLKQRCEMAAELATHDKPVTVWCETNDESAMLAKMIPGAKEVHGSIDPDQKERLLLGFADGDYRVIVTKPKLAGFGVNWQHCAHAVFASISFSYEQHYQAVRRSHRFGQSETVRNDIVISDTEASIWEIINVKSKKHDEMKRRMADAMRNAQSTTTRRVAYNRPLDLAFPEWVRAGQ